MADIGVNLQACLHYEAVVDLAVVVKLPPNGSTPKASA